MPDPGQAFKRAEMHVAQDMPELKGILRNIQKKDYILQLNPRGLCRCTEAGQEKAASAAGPRYPYQLLAAGRMVGAPTAAFKSARLSIVSTTFLAT